MPPYSNNGFYKPEYQFTTDWMNNIAVPSVGLDTVPAAVQSTAAPESFWSWDNMLGKNGQAGVLPVALGGMGSLMQGWAGMKQLQLANRQQKFNEGMARVNLANQAALTNEQLRTRQERRYRENPNKAMAPDQFMQQWAVKGSI